MTGPYDDIINLPHHVSRTRPQMSAANRAAQFSPFAALTGYDAAVKETARLTDEKIELSEYEQSVLDVKQQILIDTISEHPQVTVTYFKADEKKAGGEYLTVIERAKKVDLINRMLVLMNDLRIPFDDILDMESELFTDSLLLG